jgi:hypothetical protein
MFQPEDRLVVRARLERECDATTLHLTAASPDQLERYWFAVLRLSGGNLGALDHPLSLARLDYRDLLMAAGFGEDLEAHNRWWSANAC